MFAVNTDSCIEPSGTKTKLWVLSGLYLVQKGATAVLHVCLANKI